MITQLVERQSLGFSRWQSPRKRADLGPKGSGDCSCVSQLELVKHDSNLCNRVLNHEVVSRARHQACSSSLLSQRENWGLERVFRLLRGAGGEGTCPASLRQRGFL